MNTKQDIVIPIIYNNITAFNPYNLTLVNTEKGYNFIDRDEKLLNTSPCIVLKMNVILLTV